MTKTAMTGTRERQSSSRDSHAAIEDNNHRSVQLLYPNYGAVEALVGFSVFYLSVDQMMPVMVDALAGPLPTFVPDPFTTLIALALWGVALLTLGTQVYAQLRTNPVTFESREDRDAFLDRERPTNEEYRFNIVLIMLGAATALLDWNGAIGFLQELVPVVIELEGDMPAAMTIEKALVFAAFFVGLAAYTRGLDLLVIGGIRELFYRIYAGAWE